MAGGRGSYRERSPSVALVARALFIARTYATAADGLRAVPGPCRSSSGRVCENKKLPRPRRVGYVVATIIFLVIVSL